MEINDIISTLYFWSVVICCIRIWVCHIVVVVDVVVVNVVAAAAAATAAVLFLFQ